MILLCLRHVKSATSLVNMAPLSPPTVTRRFRPVILMISRRSVIATEFLLPRLPLIFIPLTNSHSHKADLLLVYKQTGDGQSFIGNLSVVLHFANLTRITCANFMMMDMKSNGGMMKTLDDLLDPDEDLDAGSNE